MLFVGLLLSSIVFVSTVSQAENGVSVNAQQKPIEKPSVTKFQKRFTTGFNHRLVVAPRVSNGIIKRQVAELWNARSEPRRCLSSPQTRKLLIRMPRALQSRMSYSSSSGGPAADLYPILDQSLTILGYAAFVSYFIMLIYNLVRGNSNGQNSPAASLGSLSGISAGLSNAMAGIGGYFSGRHARDLYQPDLGNVPRDLFGNETDHQKASLKWNRCIEEAKRSYLKKALFTSEKIESLVLKLKHRADHYMKILQHCTDAFKKRLEWKFKTSLQQSNASDNQVRFKS